MSTGPGCRAVADMTIRLATEVWCAGPTGPNAKMDTHPAAPAREEQAQAAAAAQKLLRCPPPEPQHPLGPPGSGGPEVHCIGHNGLHP
ncbi:UNVERIFIED_CONTAM: hypothetical protein K2H54_057188 [Gekko kuhli]